MSDRMVSFARSPMEMRDTMSTSLLQGEDYPPGLCLTLTDSELEKLSLSDDGVERGDMLHLMVMCTVSEVHHDNGGCRIVMQIIGGRVENESTESESEDYE